MGRSGLTTQARRFRDRIDAGRLLADQLSDYAGRDDVVVLGLARWGVPVAYELAEALDTPLDVFVVRKLGLPGYQEQPMGAIATGGVLVLDQNLLRRLGVSRETVERTVAAEARELQRREAAYRGERERIDLTGKTVILVDDGRATGSTMRAAAEAVRRYDPARIVAAVPVAAEETCDEFRDVVDEIECAVTPEELAV